MVGVYDGMVLLTDGLALGEGCSVRAVGTKLGCCEEGVLDGDVEGSVDG